MAFGKQKHGKQGNDDDGKQCRDNVNKVLVHLNSPWWL